MSPVNFYVMLGVLAAVGILVISGLIFFFYKRSKKSTHIQLVTRMKHGTGDENDLVQVEQEKAKRVNNGK